MLILEILQNNSSKCITNIYLSKAEKVDNLYNDKFDLNQVFINS